MKGVVVEKDLFVLRLLGCCIVILIVLWRKPGLTRKVGTKILMSSPLRLTHGVEKFMGIWNVGKDI